MFLHQLARHSNVYIEATGLLPEACRELFASYPGYKCVTRESVVDEFQVKFKMPVEGHGDVKVKGFGSAFDVSLQDQMRRCFNARNMACYKREIPSAKEKAAQDAIRVLEDKHNVVILDYNWCETELLREICKPLIELATECRNIYQYLRGQFALVLGGIKYAAEDMMQKDADLSVFECAMKLGHIYLDGEHELRRLDEDIRVDKFDGVAPLKIRDRVSVFIFALLSLL